VDIIERIEEGMLEMYPMSLGGGCGGERNVGSAR
jgi:hypothetical protein